MALALNNAHRVLITAAIVFDFFFTFWAIRQYRQSNDVKQLALVVASSAVTLALVAYLVYFNRNLSVLRYSLARRCAQCGTVLQGLTGSGRGSCPQCGAAVPGVGLGS